MLIKLWIVFWFLSNHLELLFFPLVFSGNLIGVFINPFCWVYFFILLILYFFFLFSLELILALTSWARNFIIFVIFVFSVQLLSRVQLFVTPWIAVRQASLSITNSQSLLKLMSIELVMPSSHLILCRPLLLLPPIPPSIRVFSNKLTLCMRWPKCWSFGFSTSLSSGPRGWPPSGWTV